MGVKRALPWGHKSQVFENKVFKTTFVLKKDEGSQQIRIWHKEQLRDVQNTWFCYDIAVRGLRRVGYVAMLAGQGIHTGEAPPENVHFEGVGEIGDYSGEIDCSGGEVAGSRSVFVDLGVLARQC
jgi:hypothetical protein